MFVVTYSQTENIFVHYDTVTWNQYQQKEWKALNDSARKAFSKGINYYYLRMRAGIAYFERGNYLKALSQFKKASELNDEPVVKEYIFYSLLYSGRSADALLFYYNNIGVLENRVQYEKKALRSLNIDATYQMNISDPQFATENILDETGSQILTRSFYSANFFMFHELNKRLSLFHGGNFLRKNNYTLSQTPASSETFTRFVNQYQYYGGLGINTEAGIYITSAFHFLKYNSSGLTSEPRMRGLDRSIETGTSHLIRISALKSFSLFKTAVGFTYSTLNNGTQYQGDISIIYFPLANLDLYLSGGYYLVNEHLPGQINNVRSIYKTSLGFKVMDHLWTEADYFWGEMKSMSVNEAFIVYNGLETINSKADLSLLIPAKKITFSIKASLINYSSKFLLDTGFETELNNINFNSLSFTGGIKWTI